MIGPNWPDARDEHGNRRLDDPNDFVRIEIAAALQRNIPVIPILLDGARIPKARELPDDLRDLTSRNGLDVRHASFHEDMERLIRGLKGQVDQADASAFPTKSYVRGAPSDPRNTQGINKLSHFLRDKHNQQVLGWLLGGLVVLATGLWVFFPPLKSPNPQSLATTPNVQADCGGVAIGGNVSGSTITGGATTSSDCTTRPK
jgi:hypothetical protein